MQRYLLIFLTFIAFAVSARAEHFTVYFANSIKATPADVRVHAWQHDKTSVTDWAVNPAMSHSGMAAEIDGTYYDLFVYEFDLADADGGIIFRYAAAPNGQTPDLQLVNGAVYFNMAPLDGLTPVPLTETKVYFYDAAAWDMSRASASLSSVEYAAPASWTDPGKWFTDSSGVTFPVYECVLRYIPDETGTPQISFSAGISGTGYIDIVPGALYHNQPSQSGYLAPGSFTLDEQARSFSFYFYDSTSSDYSQRHWPADIAITARSLTGTAVAFTGPVTTTDTGLRIAEANGEQHILYRCDFVWNRQPSSIDFKNQSAPRDFADGYVYAADERGMPGTSLSASVTSPSYSYTFYFADTEGWGAANTRVHAWSQLDATHNYVDFNYSPYATDTGKFVRLKDMYYPCYTVSMVSAYPLTHTQWRRNDPIRQSYNFTPVASDDLFWYTAAQALPQPGPQELVDEVPVEPGMVYFHTGANEVLAPGLWTQACAHFYRKGEPEPDLAALAELAKAGTENMTRREEGMWKIDVDDIHKYYDVGFYYLNSLGEVSDVFRASAASTFDAGTWSRYVYDIGTTQAYQSYMTPAQYEAMMADPGDNLYIIGNTPLGFPDDLWDLRRCESLPYDDGIYSRVVVAGSQSSPALFKLSFVDVNHYVETAGEVDSYDNQRGWATFNLNLIGAETRGHSWIYIGKPEGRDNRAVFTPLNNSMPYNKFNQYEWCISTRSDIYPDRDRIIEDGTYYLIIDTHSSDRSVSLISFNPRPTVEIANATVKPVGIDYAKSATVQTGGELLASHNGTVYFDRVNVASGTVKVQAAASTAELERNHYTVRYTVMANDIAFMTLDGVPDASGIEVPYLPVGDNIDLSVRARYTNTDTKISFCSLTGAGSYFSSPELAAPEIGDPVVTAFVGQPGDDCPEGWFAFGVKAAYPYSVDSPLAYTADYELDGATDGTPFVYDADGWAPYPGDGEYSASHNWSRQMTDAGSLPLVHGNIGYVEYETLQSDFTLRLKAYAVYPFLVRDMSKTVSEPQYAPRHVAADITPDDIPDDLSGYVLVAARTMSPHVRSLSNLALTGIGDIASDTTAGRYEVYNLQGIRVMLTTDASDLRTLPAGLYIINGRKHLIR